MYLAAVRHSHMEGGIGSAGVESVWGGVEYEGSRCRNYFRAVRSN